MAKVSWWPWRPPPTVEVWPKWTAALQTWRSWWKRWGNLPPLLHPSQRPPSRLHLLPGVFPPCHRVTTLFSLQEEDCHIQASPEYWSHSSLSSKSSAFKNTHLLWRRKVENCYKRCFNFNLSIALTVKAVLITTVETWVACLLASPAERRHWMLQWKSWLTSY